MKISRKKSDVLSEFRERLCCVEFPAENACFQNQQKKSDVLTEFQERLCSVEFLAENTCLENQQKKSDILTEIHERLCCVEFPAKNACFENQQKKSDVLTEFQERLYRANHSSGKSLLALTTFLNIGFNLVQTLTSIGKYKTIESIKQVIILLLCAVSR